MFKFVSCPGGFLYLNGQNFLKIWEIFCYCVECIMNLFCLELFSFSAYDSQVQSVDGVGEFFHIPFIALELFD
jgi:Gpi18-like mannosyltransferase